MKTLCLLFNHKVVGDNFYGHWCERCRVEFDWGILEPYRKGIPKGTTITIPKIAPITKEDLTNG